MPIMIFSPVSIFGGQSLDAGGVSAACTKNLEQSLMKVEVLRLCIICTTIACQILDFIWRAS